MKLPAEPPFGQPEERSIASKSKQNADCKILLNLGQGDWQTGFPNVIAQLWEGDQPPVQFTG
ncbi:MAG: hypothetical protein AAGB19_15065, partial [Cyanobacteria bacterium P01_F01_bin.3]